MTRTTKRAQDQRDDADAGIAPDPAPDPVADQPDPVPVILWQAPAADDLPPGGTATDDGGRPVTDDGGRPETIDS